jgi:hypothetical protein
MECMCNVSSKKRASAETHRALSGTKSGWWKGRALCLALAAARPSSGDLFRERFGLAAAPEDALPSLCIQTQQPRLQIKPLNRATR